MRRSPSFAICFAVALAWIAMSTPSSAQKRAITEKDLFHFRWIGDPQISPDGTRIVFVRVTVNDKRDGYETSLWIVPTEAGAAGQSQPEAQPLTNGKHDLAPRWSPDGKRLAFLRSVEQNGRPQPPQIALLSFAGGEASVITSLARGAGAPVWSPDGSKIAFSSTTAQEDSRRPRPQGEAAAPGSAIGGDEAGEQQPASAAEQPAAGDGEAQHVSDVRVITQAVYRSNGAGYLDPKHPSHIWVMDVAAAMDDGNAAKPRLLTPGKYNQGEAVWASDSATIYFTSTEVDEPAYESPHTTIYSVPAAGGSSQKLIALDFGGGGLAVSPDGKRFALVGAENGSPVRSYSEPDLWVVDIAPNAKPKNLTANFDYDVGSGIGGDNSAPRGAGGSRPVWSADGRSIIEVVGKQGRANLFRFDATTGAASEFTHGDQAIEGFNASHDRSRFAILISTPTNIGDLYLIGSDGRQQRLTDINHALFAELNLTEPEEFWYTSFDGKKIQAWIQKPPDFDPAKKYPLILNIHGGPHAAYGWVFDHEFQWMAAKGYVVLYPNPRGSTTYGQEFGNIIQHRYPGDDFKDLMIGVDEMLKKGYIDPKKLGVTGGSGGGLLTDWTVTHTNRFAAAVAQRDIADWEGWWYTADFTLFQPTWFKAPPFLDRQDFMARSPITYIQNVNTPLMLVLGEADYRTPPTSGGEEMFRALKYLKKPVIMVRFPGESHELSRSGQPWHRIERLEHIVGWFDKYLLGVDVPAYRDVAQSGASIPNPMEKKPEQPQQTVPPQR